MSDMVRMNSGTRDVETVKQHRQTRAIDFDLCKRRRREPTEGSFLETLVEEPQAVGVPEQDLHAIATLVGKHEHVAGERVQVQDAANDLAEAVMGLAKVDRLRGHEDPSRCREAQHAASSTPMRARSASGSKRIGTQWLNPFKANNKGFKHHPITHSGIALWFLWVYSISKRY